MRLTALIQWLPFGTAALGIIAFTPSIARFRRAPWWIILLGSMIGGYLGQWLLFFFVMGLSEGFVWFLAFWYLPAPVLRGLMVGAVALSGRRLLRKTG